MLTHLEKAAETFEKIIDPKISFWKRIVLIIPLVFVLIKNKRTKEIGLYLIYVLPALILLHHYNFINTSIIIFCIILIVMYCSFFYWRIRQNFKNKLEEIDYSQEKIINKYKQLKLISCEIIFSDELESVELRKIFYLINLGDIFKAKEIGKKLIQQHNPKYLFYKAIILEQEGNFLEAEEILKRLVAMDSLDLKLVISVYNNYGRFNLINKNYSEAINFYTKAIELLKTESKHVNDFKHIIYPNLIDCYCIQKEYKKMVAIKNEYYTLLSNDSIEDWIAQHNQNLIIIRQNSEKNTNFIKEQYFDILNKLREQNKFIFQINALRFFANMKLDFYEILEEINNSIDSIELNPIEKFKSFKEINIIRRNYTKHFQIKWPVLNKKILNYFSDEAIDCLENYLNSLEIEEVYERCEIINEIIGIKKEFYPYDSSHILEKMEDVLNIYSGKNLAIKEFEQRLNIIDECINPQNIESKRIVPLYYYSLRILHNLEVLENKLAQIAGHPETPCFYIRMGYYYLSQSKIEESKKYYEKFKLSKISVNHYALWIQEYENKLSQHFDTPQLYKI
ncbi:MAG: tetratricopeptide repeat protein [Cetobacterium sp.]